MPEGDTVWLTAKRLNSALAGAELTRFELRVPALATVDRRGDSIIEVVSRGKHILMRLDSDLTLRTHLRMDGSWRIVRNKAALPSPQYAIRALLGNDSWTTAGLRVHDLALVETGREASLIGHLGPDLLGPDWSAEMAVTRLRTSLERSIAEAIMDQRNLAGIGNLYKSETLFLCGVNPWTTVRDVASLDAVVNRAHRLLMANRDRPEQSTTGSLARGDEHWVYRRRNQPCRRCRTPIQVGEQGDPGQLRSTYWCPRCQPELHR